MTNDNERYAGMNRFISLVMMVIGGLMALFCGGCAMAFLPSLLSSNINEQGFGFMFVLFGAIAAAGGAGLFYAGYNVWRRT
jgi:hypothetical protein